MSTLIPEPDPTVGTLIPVTDEPLPESDEAELFEESIDAVPGAPDLIVEVPPQTPVGRGWAYDVERRDFVPALQGHGPLATYGDATLRDRISRVLRTARGAHPIYSDDYGIDLPGDFIGGPLDEFPLDEYETAVREALTAFPEIADVTDLVTTFDPLGEYLMIDFTVVKANGETEEVTNARIGS